MTRLRDRGLSRLFPDIVADGRISKAEVDRMIESANDGPGLARTERTDLERILQEHGDKFDADARAALESYLGLDPTPPPDPDPGVTVLSDRAASLTDLALVAASFRAEIAERASAFSDPKQAFSLFAEYAGKLRALGQGQETKAVDEQVESLLEAGRNSPARGYDSMDSDHDTVSDLEEVARGRDPHTFDVRVMEADHRVWTTTYWPMAGSGDGMDQAGSPASNLWAKDGPLAKLDKLLRARGMEHKAKALEFERKPALSWLIGDRTNKGEFIPSSTVDEKDAEWTTGVDFDGDGKITHGVKVDFLDKRGDFAAVSSRSQLKPRIKVGDDAIALTRKELRGDDGAISGFEFFRPDGSKLSEQEALQVFYTHPGGSGDADGSMSVGWWGSCDKVALAGILFKAPQKDSVEIDGVTFTKQDVLGLLTVIADSQARGTDFVGHRYDDRPDILVLDDGTQLRGKVMSDIEFRTKDMWRWDGDYMVLDERVFDDPEEVIQFRTIDGETKEFKARDIKQLAREDQKDIAPFTFHTTILKWLGEDKRPAASDKDSGDHVWNYNFWKAELQSAKELTADSMPSEPGHNGPVNPDHKVVEYSMELWYGEGDWGGTDHRYWIEYDDQGEVVNGGWLSGNPDFLWRPSSFNDWSGYNSRNPFVEPALVKEIYDRFFDQDD